MDYRCGDRATIPLVAPMPLHWDLQSLDLENKKATIVFLGDCPIGDKKRVCSMPGYSHPTGWIQFSGAMRCADCKPYGFCVDIKKDH